MALEDFYSMIGIDHGFKLLFLYGVMPDNGCNCVSSSCKSIGKHPIERWKGSDFLREKAVKREEVSYYTGLVKRNMYNIGVVCGKNYDQTKSMVVVDFDDVQLGKELIEQLKKENTCEVVSGKGIHFYFFGEMQSRIKIKNQGFDIISNNRFVVGPGSKHSSGKEYTWNGKSPQQLPQWFKEKYKKQTNNEDIINIEKSNQSFNNQDLIRVGYRNQTLFDQLIKVAKKTNFNKKEISKAANVCWSLMEDKNTFTKQEVERTINSVLSYQNKSSKVDKLKNNKNVFSLENASSMWVKRLINLGFLDSEEVQSMNLFSLFNSFENKVFEYSIAKKKLSETFTGHTISEFIQNRNMIMDKVFDGIPLWNYLNVEHQNWASIFNINGFNKQRYRGVKYFGKGNGTKEKIGFGFTFVDQNLVIEKLIKEFETLANLVKTNVKNPRGNIIKFNSNIDNKIAEYMGVDPSEFDNLSAASKQEPKIWPVVKPKVIHTFKFEQEGLTTLQQDTSLCLESEVTTMTTETQQSEQQEQPKQKMERKLLSETKVKVTDNTNHLLKYRQVRTMEYNEAEMNYVSKYDHDMIAAQTEGVLSDRQLVLDTIAAWKQDDIVGIGTDIFVFDAAYEEDDELVLYKKFYVKDCKPEGLVKRDANKVIMSFALLNKQIDMGYVDILYRDGEVYGLSEEEKYRTYRIYEMKKLEKESDQTQQEQTTES